MGVERVDYSSDDDFRQAQYEEEYQEQQWQAKREAEAQYQAEQQENESVPLDGLVIKKTPEDIAIENLLAFFKCFCGGTLEINGAESDGQKVTLHFGCMNCETKWKTSFHFEEE